MEKRFGVMLDMSRNGIMKPDEVKKYAATIKKLGYNMIQLYTEDTYEVPGEPYFGYLRGRYSQKELKDIVAYCNSIGVEVIP
ncbi:MAG: beta-N-acetylhexosaminidase, partial [Clostridia bacterium]|nr:beta-N-acetylhexosaminidase [Clostridia bacterium]